VKELCHKEVFDLREGKQKHKERKEEGKGKGEGVPYSGQCPSDSPPNLVQVHSKSKQLKNIANQKHKQSQDTWPFEQHESDQALQKYV
jgi:hypothetical protein